MRKIWQFLAPSKRNLDLLVWGADVAVPGLCLSDYWAFWTPGTLAAAAAAPRWEGIDRKGRRKAQMRKESLWCVSRWKPLTAWTCAFPAWLQLKRWRLVPFPHLPPPSSHLPTLKHCPGVPTFQADFQVSSLWVCECQHRVGIRHQRNQNIIKRCKTPFQRASSTVSLNILQVIPIICVYLKCVK